jgi:hypothetical protein
VSAWVQPMSTRLVTLDIVITTCRGSAAEGVRVAYAVGMGRINDSDRRLVRDSAPVLAGVLRCVHQRARTASGPGCRSSSGASMRLTISRADGHVSVGP